MALADCPVMFPTTAGSGPYPLRAVQKRRLQLCLNSGAVSRFFAALFFGALMRVSGVMGIMAVLLQWRIVLTSSACPRASFSACATFLTACRK